MGERGDRVRRHQHHGISHRGCHSTSRQGLPGRLASPRPRHISSRSWIHFRTYIYIYISTVDIQHLSYETPSFFFLTSVLRRRRLLATSTVCVQGENCGSVQNPRSSSAAIFSRWIEYFLRFLPRPRVSVVGKFLIRGTRIKQESSYGPLARAFFLSRSRISVYVQRLETKLVKLHPHVETWTFQPVYKVPLARPYRANRVSLNDSSSVRALTFFSQRFLYRSNKK